MLLCSERVAVVMVMVVVMVVVVVVVCVGFNTMFREC